MLNEFYNKKYFRLIKIIFNESDKTGYTYVAHENYKIKKGDLVTVTTGKSKSFEFIKVVKVVAVTDNMVYMSNDYELKHIVGKVNMKFYKKVAKAYQNN